MASKDIEFMKLALAEAKKALKKDKLPVGTVVVIDGNIIARGRKKDDNIWLDHAEIIALRQALKDGSRDTSKMTIYTTLEPCIMCFGTIIGSRIGRLVYALEDPYGGATHLKEKHMPERQKVKFPKITKGVLREDAKELFKEFFQTTKEKFYTDNPNNPLIKLCHGR